MTWNFTIVNGPYGGVAEGPAWDGSGLLFTHIPSSRILRYDPQNRGSTLYRENTNNANGLMLDSSGTLFACEGGGRRVVRYEADGSATVLADGFEGQKLNIPNDLAIDPQGRVWFTDPFYEGAGGEWSNDRSNKELEHDSVFRLDSGDNGDWSITRVTFDITRPNGLLFSLDHMTLYVAQSGRGPDEKRELRAYPVNDDGSLGDGEVIHDFGEYRGIDGMALLLLVLTTFLTPLTLISSWTSINKKVKEFTFFMLFLELGMLGVFVSLDLFLFYFFWEAMLIPFFFIL